MKVNKRNLIELVLQVVIISLAFVKNFFTHVWKFDHYIDYYDSWIHNRMSCLDFVMYIYEDWFHTDLHGIIISAIFLFILICGVVILVIQFLGKKRNILIAPIITVTETLFLIFTIMVSFSIRWHDDGAYTIIGALFYIIPLLLIALSVISVLGYIKAKKKGITDEPLIKAKQVQISSDYDGLCHGEAYRNLALFVFLYIITFGIWNYVWIYKTTKFLNKTPNTEIYSPTKKLLLCIFVPMYQIYWYYKHGEKVDNFCLHKGLKNSYLTILCTLIPITLVSSVMMQDKINQICTRK